MDHVENRAERFVNHPNFAKFVLYVILLNSFFLGIQTFDLPDYVRTLVNFGDRICIMIFVAELLLKIAVYKRDFFKSGWNIFDFVVITISLAPFGHSFSVLRTLAALRALRIVSNVGGLRRVVKALIYAIPGVGAAGVLLLLILYVAGVVGFNLFHEAFPQWFGSLGKTLFTLFQIMTLESWSMAIVRPVMEQFPAAWMFFVTFILLSTFVLLNLLIGIIVDAIAHMKHEENEHGDLSMNKQEILHSNNDLMKEIKSLKYQITRVEKLCK